MEALLKDIERQYLLRIGFRQLIYFLVHPGHRLID